jgi:hypothetical protein
LEPGKLSTATVAALRAPFAPEQIGKLPRGNVQLDFVGHAAVTDRLLSVDPFWSWEPVAFDPDGAPLIRHDGNRHSLWIYLTVCGVSRLGVGIVNGDKQELEKELISDALRNAAMRFGVALDLWSKTPLGLDGESSAQELPSEPAPRPRVPAPVEQLSELHERIEMIKAQDAALHAELLEAWKAVPLGTLNPEHPPERQLSVAEVAEAERLIGAAETRIVGG